MQLGNQVEWALHCCTVLAGLPPGRTLNTASLAEFHGVPKAYLAKALQRLAEAMIVDAVSGPQGGYRLNHAAEDVTLLMIVEAVEGKSKSFVCTEIRCNNPCGIDPESLKSPCLIATAMHEADQAWRESLAKTTLREIVETLYATLTPDRIAANTKWFAERMGGKEI